MSGERGVEFFIELTRHIVGDVEQGRFGAKAHRDKEGKSQPPERTMRREAIKDVEHKK
jgi:hypothetical protein